MPEKEFTGREKNCRWHFDAQTGQHEGPNDATAFHFTGDVYPTLIREAVQNSLDAVLDEKKPVVVNIEFRELAWVEYKNFFKLREHIQGCIDLYGKKAERFKPMLEHLGDGVENAKIGYVKITDSNTKGMKYVEDDSNCSFYAFALSKGLSVKDSENSGGSFGFGKTAYFTLSPIRTIFISSRYHKDNKPVFIGVSSLCTHKIGNEYKTSVGYYGNIVGQGEEERVIPVTSHEEIPVKFRQDEPGTSISIIGVKVDDDSKNEAKEEMVEAVLRNYWLAIWEGKLEVCIEGDMIDKDSIVDLMGLVFPDETDKTNRKKLYNPRPYFDAVRFCGTEEKYIKRDAVPIETGAVDLYVNVNKDAPRDKIIYMRRNLMYIYSDNRHTNYGYNALFVCRGGKGDKILRELENAAHDEWDPKNRRTKLGLQEKNTEGQVVLDAINDFIVTEIEKIFRTDDRDSINIAGLEDYLYIPEDLISHDVVPETDRGTLLGQPTGGYMDDGSSPQTEITEPAKIHEEPNTQMGHVVVTSPGTVTQSDLSDMVVGAGHAHGDKGPKPKGPRASGNFKRAEVNIEGEGTYAEYIPVRYRVVAQTIDGEIYHNIIFHSPKATNNGGIELVVGGEQTNEVVDVLETSEGRTQGNFVVGLRVAEGENIVRIRFNDNLRHAVILKTYEHK